MIDIQKLLDGLNLSEERRAVLEGSTEEFERLLRKLIDWQPTTEAKEEMLAAVGRLIAEYEREVENFLNPR